MESPIKHYSYVHSQVYNFLKILVTTENIKHGERQHMDCFLTTPRRIVQSEKNHFETTADLDESASAWIEMKKTPKNRKFASLVYWTVHFFTRSAA